MNDRTQRARFSGPVRVLFALLALPGHWRARRRNLEEVEALSGERLRDIGLSELGRARMVHAI